MARIEEIEEETRDIRKQDIVKATYCSSMIDNLKIIQINTYGKDTRVVYGSPSQIIQFDKKMAVRLINMLKKEFEI